MTTFLQANYTLHNTGGGIFCYTHDEGDFYFLISEHNDCGITPEYPGNVDVGMYLDADMSELAFVSDVEQSDVPETIKRLIEAGKVAKAFSQKLQEEIGREKVLQVVDVNRGRRAANPKDSSCASHDFCDANMAMDAAMRETLGLEEYQMMEDDSGLDRVWNTAWDVARENVFWTAV